MACALRMQEHKLNSGEQRINASFKSFVCKVEGIAKEALAGGEIHKVEDVEKILKNAVNEELRRKVPLAERQEMGAFFTGKTLRKNAFHYLNENNNAPTVLDPACGAGDLLISYAEKLPVKKELAETIEFWGGVLFAIELQEDFLRLAKARLVLLAYLRGARAVENKNIKIEEVFKNFKNANSLDLVDWPKTDHVVLNPPYIYMKSEVDCDWTTGSVSAAAVFVEHCIKKCKDASLIVGILPDVLRTGTRYKRWRDLVERKRKVNRADIYGAFDPQADVDVFILELGAQELDETQGGSNDASYWSKGAEQSSLKVSDLFSVCVGSVVPHRDEEQGPRCVYIHTRDAPPWGEISSAPGYRDFDGTTHNAPFVIVRRTSSPSDKNRAIATLVTCGGAVAVENHLIVLKPVNKTLEECVRLIEFLKREEVDDWLNERIRCRHLTVTAVKEIPWRSN